MSCCELYLRTSHYSALAFGPSVAIHGMGLYFHTCKSSVIAAQPSFSSSLLSSRICSSVSPSVTQPDVSPHTSLPVLFARHRSRTVGTSCRRLVGRRPIIYIYGGSAGRDENEKKISRILNRIIFLFNPMKLNLYFLV